MVFTVQDDGSLQYFDHVNIFPAFYSVDRNAVMHQVLAESLHKDVVCPGYADKVVRFSIHLIDVANLATIHELAQNMAVSFPHINQINFLFEHRCEIVRLLFDH
jgi:hypothetical protein